MFVIRENNWSLKKFGLSFQYNRDTEAKDQMPRY